MFIDYKTYNNHIFAYINNNLFTKNRSCCNKKGTVVVLKPAGLILTASLWFGKVATVGVLQSVAHKIDQLVA